MQVVFHGRSIHTKAQLRLMQELQLRFRLQIVSELTKNWLRFGDFEGMSSAHRATRRPLCKASIRV